MAPFRATQTYEYCREYRSHQLDEADLAALCAKPFVAAPAKVQAARRQQVVVKAQAEQQPLERRAVLGLMAAAVLGLGAGAAQAAQPAPKNGSQASMEGYNMEGTKKMGISADRKKKLLAKLRAQATQ